VFLENMLFLYLGGPVSLVFLMGLRRFIFFGALILLLGAMASMSFQVLTVEALIPSVVSVVSYDVGSVTWLNITINHTPPPSIGSGHYVSLVQVEVNGTVQDLGQTPQSTETFSVQYSLGSNTDSYSVRARAYCNLHGFSSWSSLSMVPEYSLPAVVLFIALVTVAAVFAKRTLGRRLNPMVL
jgi:desulfoferrodoxin (superoxide reductase-like protein)